MSRPRLKDEDGNDVDGFKIVHHDDVTAAAVTYRKVRDKRMSLTEAEGKAKADLLVAMKKHNLEVYVDADEELKVELVSEAETVRVKRYAPKDEDGGDE